jgi:hypothetical protein
MSDATTAIDAVVRRRRLLSLLGICFLALALPYGFGHPGVHAVRNLLVPGAGLYDHKYGWIGAAFTVAAIAATVLWLKWGVDWLVGAVTVSSMAVAAFTYDDHVVQAVSVAASAHEFPLVVLVMGALSWGRLAWRRSPLPKVRVVRARTSEPTPCRINRVACFGARTVDSARTAARRRRRHTPMPTGWHCSPMAFRR